MKTTLFLSTLAAGVVAVSTATFAQNFGGYPQAYGDAAATPRVEQRYTAPIERLSHSDFGYVDKANAPRGKARSSRTRNVGEPAPAQHND
jgi:hypothetical protein